LVVYKKQVEGKTKVLETGPCGVPAVLWSDVLEVWRDLVQTRGCTQRVALASGSFRL